MTELNNNLDGIKKARQARKKQIYYVIPQVHSFTISDQSPLWPQRFREFARLGQKKIYLTLLTIALLASFGGGMMVALRTPRSEAEAEKAQAQKPQVYEIPLENVKVITTSPDVPNEVLFNTPLEMLQDYLVSKVTPDILAIRKNKLKEFLTEKRSPFADEADTIAEQDHWKLILAISFAESTLGKHCPDNNCSGIGVEPGNPAWRKYKSLRNWILDFNRLLEKRYKDQTLEQMCGVYVQPCNPNWLLATRQILSELKEEGIE